MRRRRPILGIVSGVVFGLFGALSLALLGIVALDSILLTIVLALGIVLGIALGFTAPLGRRRGRADKVPAEAAAAVVAGDAPAAVTTDPAPAEPDAVSGQAAAAGAEAQDEDAAGDR